MNTQNAQNADTVRHVQVDTPNWDTKVRCSCGAEFVSRCEFWKHGYEALLAHIDGDVHVGRGSR